MDLFLVKLEIRTLTKFTMAWFTSISSPECFGFYLSIAFDAMIRIKKCALIFKAVGNFWTC